MKKYVEVFRLSFKMQLVWRFDVAMTMLATLGRIVAAWILWRIVYGERALVAGLSLQVMLSYYIVSAFLTSLDMSNQISDELSHLIRSGGFSKHMVTPMNPFGFFSAMVAGESAFHLGFSCLAALICTLLLNIQIVLVTDAAALLSALIMVPLGLLCMMCFHYLVAMLAFRFISIGSFLHAANALVAFLTGVLVPLALLPEWMTTFMRLFPFYYVTYLPSMLLIGQRSNEAAAGLLILSLWTLGLLAAGNLTYHRLRVRYDGVGI